MISRSSKKNDLDKFDKMFAVAFVAYLAVILLVIGGASWAVYELVTWVTSK